MLEFHSMDSNKSITFLKKCTGTPKKIYILLFISTIRQLLQIRSNIFEVSRVNFWTLEFCMLSN